MNARERWNAVLHYKPYDRVFNREFGYWDETIPRWHAEGLDAKYNSEETLDPFIGFDGMEGISLKLGFLFPFAEKVIEENKDYKIVVDHENVTKKIFTGGATSIPHYIDYGLKDRETWKEYKQRLVKDRAKRIPADIDARVAKAKATGNPVIISAGSLLGVPRDLIGFENFAMMFYDDPVLMEEIIETWADLIVDTLEPVLKKHTFDAASMWEDIAFNHGPIISPEMFNKYAAKHYKRITGLLGKYGTDLTFLDCDGRIYDLAGCWLDCGVNIMFPIEVNGTDPLELRKRFGKEMRLMGGVDKTKLSKGKTEIDAELRRILPLVENGGYIPHVDHRCPPDVSWENYVYYLNRKKELFGMKDWNLDRVNETLKK